MYWLLLIHLIGGPWSYIGVYAYNYSASCRLGILPNIDLL